ncbi:hydrogenase expression/formation protein HypE [Fervidicoccus fontis]|uniref:Hydrogenase expression/formation protein HypE n=1 Tax=Fervidicoccus fontis TaxID=683846 RepID=A0A843A9S5_9CREN|nr:hydrogenase expression/formation protein HypE [Fervidicoccus fontis]MBE9391445.1 hydrogenase expression/formation protein HypE [Fervidicoccus fontis]
MKILEEGKTVKLSHGNGGPETSEILNSILFSKVEETLKRVEGGVGIDVLDDGATIPIGDLGYVVISTDSYTVKPLFFPGGDIGKLAAAGSINDVVMMGGRPVAILDSIVVQEGFEINELEKIMESFISTLKEEKVSIIGGDFKVLPREELDGIIITTTAIGIAKKPIIDRPKVGDKIIVTGNLAEHGVLVSLYRLGLEDKAGNAGLLQSDVMPLSKYLLPIFEKYGEKINAARDPTRGGLSEVLNEWALQNKLIIEIDEKSIPLREPVVKYTEMLGIDPLHLASEGVAVLSVEESVSEEILDELQKNGLSDAKIIGEVKKEAKEMGIVLMKTAIGGRRVVEPPRGELVPRIC